jgi:two-component system response regulator (stage 0 sporulation protein F)
MDEDSARVKLLLVDDEVDFRRATSAALGRRGFLVTEAASGVEALNAIRSERPDIVLLDLKMPGMSGVETLQEIRKQDAVLPVIILTGHGDYDAAIAGIKLSIVDFLQKPIDMDQLGDRIRDLLERGIEHEPLRERTISELMVSPSLYPRLSADKSVADAVRALREIFCKLIPEGSGPGEVRSALVYGQDDKFIGIIRFHNLLRSLLPPYIGDSPYATFFTGMFLAQCKVLGNRTIEELVSDQVTVDVDAPLMEAVHLLVEHHLINLPVMRDDELVGILRGRDIILEAANSMGSLE